MTAGCVHYVPRRESMKGKYQMSYGREGMHPPRRSDQVLVGGIVHTPDSTGGHY